MLFICYLVVTSENKIEFKKENSNRKKYVVLTLEFNVNCSKDYKYQISSIIRLKITKYLLVLKYKNKCKYLKYLKTQVVLLLHSLLIIHIE